MPSYWRWTLLWSFRPMAFRLIDLYCKYSAWFFGKHSNYSYFVQNIKTLWKTPILTKLNCTLQDNEEVRITFTLAEVVRGMYPEEASNSRFSCTTERPTNSLKWVFKCLLKSVLPLGMERIDARSSDVKRTSYTMRAPCTPGREKVWHLAWYKQLIPGSWNKTQFRIDTTNFYKPERLHIGISNIRFLKRNNNKGNIKFWFVLVIWLPEPIVNSTIHSQER